MIHEPSLIAVLVFAVFVAVTLGISFYFAAKSRSSAGYFAAHGQVHWFVNGVAFAGDYLSAASFLGICGMIAFYGYDGFLYSIGYLAGWVVALFVIAEPLRRLGRFTFADALDAQFRSRGVRLTVAVSTLAVSLFYLIPQMVGAGALIQPLLGLPHWAGVLIVGITVIVITTTAGMVSTTYVQFLKGALLVLFSLVLTGLVLDRGLTAHDGYRPHFNGESRAGPHIQMPHSISHGELLPELPPWTRPKYIRVLARDSGMTLLYREVTPGVYQEAQTLTVRSDGSRWVNGLRLGSGGPGRGEAQLSPGGTLARLPYTVSPTGFGSTGAVGPVAFLASLNGAEVYAERSETVRGPDGTTTVLYLKPTPGADLLQPGNHPSLAGLRGDVLLPKLNFLSLMLALFCGTAALPHILIRYYTVADETAARKSTVVGIGTIGLFYVLTLFIGLGAMTSGALDPTNSNLAAPLLARSFGEPLFAAISAIAFTTVLGTVAGLIVAAGGAVAHDFAEGVLRLQLSDDGKVRLGRLTAFAVGSAAIALGIVFRDMNVTYLVGWAFSVAASANLPALIMLLFWSGTTRYGIIASVATGMASSLTWILLSADTYRDVYRADPADSVVPFSQPGLVTIPLSFAVLVVVSLLTRGIRHAPPPSGAAAAYTNGLGSHGPAQVASQVGGSARG